jgi:hypothetical protein
MARLHHSAQYQQQVAAVALMLAQELLAVLVVAAVLAEVRPALLPPIKVMPEVQVMCQVAAVAAAVQVLLVRLHRVDLTVAQVAGVLQPL